MLDLDLNPKDRSSCDTASCDIAVVLKLKHKAFTIEFCLLKIQTGHDANSVDLDQTAPLSPLQSYLGLCCLPRPV